jgi:F-type H+-transporting ATPase subunit a
MAKDGHSAPYSFLQQIPGLHEVPNHVLLAGFVALVLVVTTFIARGQLSAAMKRADGAIVPEPRLTYRNFFEIIAEKLYALTESVIGHHDAPRFFPVIGTLFLFVFTCNILGIVPGLGAATENLNTTLALGLFVFLYYNFAGLRANGLSYLKHFWGPIFWLGPLMLVIEIASHVFRPLSLALRLRGNIMGDHVVLHIFSEFVPIGLPVIFLGLGVFVAFVQAFVFCLMTMVYISLSTAHDH